jgi:riboflavin kinase/FMN adenylyltransferase
VKVAHAPEELAAGPRAVAIGTFDGVHLGHRAVVEAAVESGLPVTAITFDPHPRSVLADESVPLLSSLERRLELLAELGVGETLVLRFDRGLASLEADAFVQRYVRGIGAAVVAAGATFRFGRDRAGGLDLIAASGLDVRAVPVVERVSSSRIRQLVAAGEVEAAAQLLGRPVEVEGTVVSGDARGAGLGFPTANLDPPPGVIVPKLGIYAGAALDARAAVSVGTNPTYGVDELRIEAFLLDFEGDLYGRRLVVELWRRLRDEAAFASEQELVDQIARDVAETRAAVRPGPTRAGDSTG